MLKILLLKMEKKTYEIPNITYTELKKNNNYVLDSSLAL